MKGQNRGHCQVCGQIQVVLPSGLMSIHGYKVSQFGYFHGVCYGNKHQPLEVSRVELDRTVEGLVRYAGQQQMAAERLQSGADLLERVAKRSAWGDIVRVDWRIDKKQPAVMIDWHAASEQEQQMGKEQAVQGHLSEARHARSFATDLGKLAFRVHGQPLIDRDQEELEAKRIQAEKKAPIPGAFRTKAAQKDAMEGLNRRYDKLLRVIRDHHYADPQRSSCEALQEFYYNLPYQLSNFRPKHAALVRNFYPAMEAQVVEIESLVAQRAAIKAMPVIK